MQYLKKEVRDDKHQSFLQVDFNTLDIKVPYKVMLSLLIRMIKQSIQNNKFAISVQYLKKKLGMEFIRVKHQSFCKLVLLFLMEVVRHVQSTQKRNLVIFLQFFKKKSVATTFVFFCDAKHSDILWGSSHVRSYLLFIKPDKPKLEQLILNSPVS